MTNENDIAYYLITYEKHIGHKHTKESVIVRGNDPETLLKQMLDMNQKKLLATTTYNIINLTELFEKSNLNIIALEKPLNDSGTKDD